MQSNRAIRRGFPMLLAAALLVGIAGRIAFVSARENPETGKADRLFQKKHYAEARVLYEKVYRAMPKTPEGHRAARQAITCRLRMQQFAEALTDADAYLVSIKGIAYEARWEHFLGNLYFQVPHEGTKQGGRFLRAKYGQGVHYDNYKEDRKKAIEHLEHARELYAVWLESADKRAQIPDKELNDYKQARLDANFDLAAAVMRATRYRPLWDYWDEISEADVEESEDDAGTQEDAEYDSPHYRRGRYRSGKPRGLRLGPDGKPVFTPLPKEYGPRLPEPQKVRFLLNEVVSIDHTKRRENAALAAYRWAMICRARYGPDRIWQGFHRVGSDRLQEKSRDEMVRKLWELGDDEAFTWVESELRVVRLPEEHSPVSLLLSVVEKYQDSEIAPEAQYAKALYFQTRQQFTRAINEYGGVRKLFAKSARANAAGAQVAVIKTPEVMIEPLGIHLPGSPAEIRVRHRNTTRIEFRAVEVDLAKYVLDGMRSRKRDRFYRVKNLSGDFIHKNEYKRYARGDAREWSATVEDDGTHRARPEAVKAPDLPNGAYVIEASVKGCPQTARNLLLISDVAILQKSIPGKGLFYLADARTGHPIDGQVLHVFEHWGEYSKIFKRHIHKGKEKRIRTPENGLVPYKREMAERGSNVDAVAVLDGNRMAFSFYNYWRDRSPSDDFDSGNKFFVVTDRPVYRPGQTVKFKVWSRRRNRGAYADPQNRQRINVEIFDPKNNGISSCSLVSDEFGGGAGQLTLAEGCPLGLYRMKVNRYWPDGRRVAGGMFRVEEYKRPEFEVTVKPDSPQVKLGKKVKVRIEARYYFGAPVSQGKARYKIFRENYRMYYSGWGEYDWLYGKGYGHCYYPLHWLGWWRRDMGWFASDVAEEDWRRYLEGSPPKAIRELVDAGEKELGKEGYAIVEIDTGPALRDHPDTDNRYTVEVEVRDPSRRTITGGGDVVVTRQQYYAFIESDRGWYKPGQTAFLDVRTLTPDSVPVAARGEVTVRRIKYSGPYNSEVEEETLKSWGAETDADGRLKIKLPLEKDGQYRVSFSAQDAWGEMVEGNAAIWVAGPDFDGRRFKFNNLEIITDKRTYRPGEVAHLLLNTDAEDAIVLFSTNANRGVLVDYRLIPLPNKSKVIDVKVDRRHVPNFFVEANLIRNGNLYVEKREMYVPPSGAMLKVTAAFDKADYRPRSRGSVSVKTLDANGEPVKAQLVMTAYDKSINYIQPEFGPDIRSFFWGERRMHNVVGRCSGDMTFTGRYTFRSPEYMVGYCGMPPDWNGVWGGGRRDWRTYGATNETQGWAQTAPMQREMDSVAGSLQLKEEVADAEAPMMARAKAAAPAGGEAGGGEGGPEQPDYAETELRTDFAETACWMPSLATGADGVTDASFEFPDSLTTWRLRVFGMTKGTKVGSAEASATTSKNLIVRLQSPRFFVERDEVVISANVHNYLEEAKDVKVVLSLPGGLFEALTPLEAKGSVEPGAQKRFDWPIRVKQAGMAEITVKALTDVESDAMQMAFPVLVHGINKMVASTGSYRPKDEGARTIELEVPHELDPEQTELVVTLSPSLAGVMLDALPYLVGYPYGCVEQTMSRFMPSVLVAQVLRKTGLDLEEVSRRRKQMNPEDLKHRFGYLRSPVFDTDEMNRMIKAGLNRIYDFQHWDGGWGWWKDGDSCPFQTAYVVYGLNVARKAGVVVEDGCYNKGMNYLAGSVFIELLKKEDKRRLGGPTTQAYLAFVLSLEKRADEKWLTELHEKRDLLNLYGKALLSLALHNMGRGQEAATVLRNVMQYAEQDDENETAWFKTPQDCWWFWWNNDIETNAWILQAIAVMDPENPIAPRLVKWLLNNRRNGYYWRSTRDTAYCIAAMASYMEASGEFNPESTVTVKLDGRQVHRVTITKDNFFDFENRLRLTGPDVTPGKHTLLITKEGPGALYYSSYLSYFTKEEDIKGAGNEIFVTRDYFLLKEKTGKVTVDGAGGRKVIEKRAGYERVPLKIGDTVASGQLVEVVLRIKSKNDYDFLVFEDMKPAGCEPVELRSGGRWAGGLCANLELRDEKVAFFIGLLEQGEHILKYKLRAEIPGKFHALPCAGYAMYAPEVKAISDEMRLGVTEQE